MVNKATIQINFGNTIRQAERLEVLAGELKNLANDDIGDSLRDISANWSGEAAEGYLKKGEFLKDEMVVSSEHLLEIAGRIRKIAQNIYTAEMEAYELGIMRTFNQRN